MAAQSTKKHRAGPDGSTTDSTSAGKSDAIRSVSARTRSYRECRNFRNRPEKTTGSPQVGPRAKRACRRQKCLPTGSHCGAIQAASHERSARNPRLTSTATSGDTPQRTLELLVSEIDLLELTSAHRSIYGWPKAPSHAGPSLRLASRMARCPCFPCRTC